MNWLGSREAEGYSIVALPADFDQNDWLAFRGRVNRALIDRGINRVIVDCRENHDLPSIAYGSLTTLSRDFRRIDGMLILVHVSSKDRAVLRRTGIDQFIPIYRSMSGVFRRQAPAVPRPMARE